MASFSSESNSPRSLVFFMKLVTEESKETYSFLKQMKKSNTFVVLWDELLEDDKIISGQIMNFMAV